MKKILKMSYLFKQHYGNGFRVVTLYWDTLTHRYSVSHLWSNFFTNVIFNPYKVVYEGSSLREANKAFKEALKIQIWGKQE